MMLMMAVALLAPVEAALPAEAAQSNVPVKVWISSNGIFRSGSGVRVQIETGRAGHLLVLQYDPAGRVRVLFPLEPGDDAFVQPGRRYELRQDGGRSSFVAAEGGIGLVYAALAEDPFRLEAYVTQDGAWFPEALAIDRSTEDPEAALTALVQRMSSERGFDYDVLDYQVAGEIATKVEVPAWWSPSYGVVTDPYCMGCGGWADGVYISVGVGFGWGWGWPYYPYYPYWGWGGYWGYGGGYYPPYYPGYYPPYYPGYYPPYYPGGWYPSEGTPRINGRPRGYTVDTWGNNPEPRARGGSASPASRDGSKTPTPARRARPRPDDQGGRAVQSGQSGSSGKASGNPEKSGSDKGNAASGKSGSGSGTTGGRARPREGRPASETRSAVQPWVERERPVTPGRNEWVRVDEPQAAGTPVTAATRSRTGDRSPAAARPRGGASSGTAGAASAPEARRMTPRSEQTVAAFAAQARARAADARQSSPAGSSRAWPGGVRQAPARIGGEGGEAVAAKPSQGSGRKVAGSSTPSRPSSATASKPAAGTAKGGGGSVSRPSAPASRPGGGGMRPRGRP